MGSGVDGFRYKIWSFAQWTSTGMAMAGTWMRTPLRIRMRGMMVIAFSLETAMFLSPLCGGSFILKPFYPSAFLSWVNFPDHRVLRTSTKKRMFKRLGRNYSNETVSSYLGLLKHGNTHNLKKYVIFYWHPRLICYYLYILKKCQTSKNQNRLKELSLRLCPRRILKWKFPTLKKFSLILRVKCGCISSKFCRETGCL